MTHQRLAAARRLMARSVPGALPEGVVVSQMEPVSFSLLDFNDQRMIFRLVGRRGEMLDLELNPVVAGALRDCVVMTAYLSETGQTVPRHEGPAG